MFDWNRGKKFQTKKKNLAANRAVYSSVFNDLLIYISFLSTSLTFLSLMTSFNKIERIKIPCGAGGKGRK